MTDAVLSGSYAGFRLVKTRRVVVVEVEVPIEALQRVLDVLGTPDPATETPVAIARLDETAAALPSSPAAAVESRPTRQTPDGGAARPRTPWHELTRAQQAGIRCGDERFEEFLVERFISTAYPLADSDPEKLVRRWCGVSTRAHLDVDRVAGGIWDKLDDEYRRWAGLEAEPR